ncbi:hypothetical protein DPMN_098147 [Dreissena polymorpha]|uniref:Uncharacterized protein n=1 Tax=Dreissena polymorpha TaxID=45954 RepID=A0A9D4LD11_DREPO|nr:hypothetical protein DPMN_098147 [Dreissena polymorpha]
MHFYFIYLINKHDRATFALLFSSESISSVGARTTADTLERHGKIAGGFSREVQETYTNLVESGLKQFSAKKEFRREEDLKAVVTFLQAENLCRVVGTRSHKTFTNMQSEKRSVSRKTFVTKMRQLSQKLDSRRKVVG